MGKYILFPFILLVLLFLLRFFWLPALILFICCPVTFWMCLSADAMLVMISRSCCHPFFSRWNFNFEMWVKRNRSFLTLLLLFITAIKILIQYPSEKCKMKRFHFTLCRQENKYGITMPCIRLYPISRKNSESDWRH